MTELKKRNQTIRKTHLDGYILAYIFIIEALNIAWMGSHLLHQLKSNCIVGVVYME